MFLFSNILFDQFYNSSLNLLDSLFKIIHLFPNVSRSQSHLNMLAATDVCATAKGCVAAAARIAAITVEWGRGLNR